MRERLKKSKALMGQINDLLKELDEELPSPYKINFHKKIVDVLPRHTMGGKISKSIVDISPPKISVSRVSVKEI